MEDNFTYRAPEASRRSSGQQQTPPRRPPEQRNASLPSLRPSNITPRQYTIPRGSSSHKRGAEPEYSLHSTNDIHQSSASRAAYVGLGSSSSAFQQTPRTTFPELPAMASSCGPIHSQSHFPSAIDHNRHRVLSSHPASSAHWKSGRNVSSLPSADFTRTCQENTSGSLFQKSPTVSSLHATAKSRATSQVADSLFVDQGVLNRGNPLLDNPTAHLHAPSSPLRIPSPANCGHIEHLRFLDKQQSQAFKSGFFPDTEEPKTLGSSSRKPVTTTASADGLQEGFAAIKVSGFILEDEDEEYRTSSRTNRRKHKNVAIIKQNMSSRPRASTLSSIPVSHDTEPQSILKKQSGENDAMHRQSDTTQGTGKEKAVTTAKKSTEPKSFSLLSNMMAKAPKPSIRIVTVPKPGAKPIRRAQCQDDTSSKT
ncbi:hypothetical protein BDP55DRAFT_758094 [Colletotrichum godetiae]|uniref:Uncharacterized protein n=1 Tax=Colletotrichum godetiae TaxID=1209918 RepID=A0AAJ0F1X7_9PEZI|nr:uncharacterized protein BDP55DRAFT_758094 [Colletotrichum godetiae]KAK1689968.1 hypothetical protein BDP55DRAFT_758094 [Colletotrichum godetiae]